MVAFSALLGTLDRDPLRRGKQFERICQWFLRHDPVYAHELRHVWLWDEWPGRWGIDAGIDLVAEDRSGKLWAIQAKAYGRAETITKRDVNTFLSESGRSQFSFRLMIATTNLIGPTARRTIEGQEKQASVLLLSELEAAEVDWPTSPSNLRAPRRAPKRPWPHQREAVNNVVRGFSGADRGQLIMACGTGKTLTALFINEKLAADRTLVLLPSLSLLAQTLREWTANSKVEFDFLPVCSDETVAEPDAAVATTSDLGFPVTTDPEEIAAFLRRRSDRRVVLATYQSSPQIAKAFTLGRVPRFDLVIADEAHRCAGPASSDFATILDAEAIKAQRRLFMTAIPRYFTGRVVREAKKDEFEIASMDNEAKFGRVFHRLSFAKAIEQKLLTDYQVIVVGVDNATYRDWAERGRFVTIDGKKITDARTLAGQIGLAKAMRRYDLRRTISFHSRVRRARDFAHSLPQVITWMPPRQRPTKLALSAYASGEMSAGQRHVLLERLRRIENGERGLLANARCLAEGVDVPTLDGVAFIDPRRSEVDIVQAVGRAIRLAPDKTVGTIVIPVFIDTYEDPEIALNDSVFKPVWDVVKALRSHDEELGEELDELRRQLGRHGRRPRRPGKIHLDLRQKVSIDFARAFDVRLVEETTASWEEHFGCVEGFISQKGHSHIPYDYMRNGASLGRWCDFQRYLYAKGTLSAERQQRLQDLDGWSWNLRDSKWEKAFQLLLRYVDGEGDARVPKKMMFDGYPLGAWVDDQRVRYLTGILDSDRKERLERLSGWSWEPTADRWEEGFRHLQEFVTRHGHARVTGNAMVNGYALGRWVSKQRARHAKGTLKEDMRSRLDALPEWSWEVHADRWEEGYRHLRAFVDQHRHSRVAQSDVLDGYPLGTWVAKQRRDYTRGSLSSDRAERLEALPRWSWNLSADKWEEAYQRLCEYIDHHGDALVPQSFVSEGIRLGNWVNTQRNNLAAGKLNPDRRKRLEALKGWAWDVRKAKR